MDGREGPGRAISTAQLGSKAWNRYTRPPTPCREASTYLLRGKCWPQSGGYPGSRLGRLSILQLIFLQLIFLQLMYLLVIIRAVRPITTTALSPAQVGSESVEHGGPTDQARERRGADVLRQLTGLRFVDAVRARHRREGKRQDWGTHEAPPHVPLAALPLLKITGESKHNDHAVRRTTARRSDANSNGHPRGQARHSRKSCACPCIFAETCLRPATYLLPATCYLLPATCYLPSAACCPLPAPCCLLPAACSRPGLRPAASSYCLPPAPSNVSTGFGEGSNEKARQD